VAAGGEGRSQGGVGIAPAQRRQVLPELDGHVDGEAGRKGCACVVRNSGSVAVWFAASAGPAAAARPRRSHRHPPDRAAIVQRIEALP
ncbi:MAG: hypothetical protein ABIP94_13900, partial [Planctomycetota bacterium]